jgi:hypothetical protein
VILAAATSARPIGIAAMCLGVVLLIGFVLWWAFAEFRDFRIARDLTRHNRRSLPRMALHPRPGRHDLAATAAIGTVAQRGLDAPTGHLDPQQIARLMETTR